MLTRIREFYDRPVTINTTGGSGHRCVQHNIDVGGKPGSRHLVGQAADFKVSKVSPAVVQDQLRLWYPNKYGIGRGATFTHIDVRDSRATWSY